MYKRLYKKAFQNKSLITKTNTILSMSSEEIVHLFGLVRDCTKKDWTHNEKRFKGMISEYAKLDAIAFAEWVYENSWYHNGEQWRKLHDAHDLYTTEQLYELYKSKPTKP